MFRVALLWWGLLALGDAVIDTHGGCRNYGCICGRGSDVLGTMRAPVPLGVKTVALDIP